MQIFGQVWLWSLGSFLLGVLFTWLLLVRPIRKRVGELEDAGSNQPREFRQPTRVAEPVGPPTGKEADRFLDDLFDTPKAPPAPPQHHAPVQQPIRPPQLPPPPMPASAQPGPTAPPELPPPPMPIAPPELPPQPQHSFSSRLDPQAPPEPPIPDESDTELSDAPFRQFTESTTVFVPPADLRMPDKAESSGEDWFAKEAPISGSINGTAEEADPHLITDVEDDEQVDAQGTIFTQHTTPIPDGMIRSLDNETPAQPEPEPASEAVQHYEPDAPAPEPVQHYEPELPQHIEPPKLPDPEPVDVVEPAATQRFEPVAAPAAEQDSSRSLFEPVVPVADQQDEAAVAGSDEFVPPGPFGPGSAMPLPGGGAPAPEFNVKASVTALRYCTQDNPQFDRIVAEVWFRSPSDAERVGFRVLS
ncbi:sunset domain-containing protein [Kibdelosporangium aridum]|uniref:Uncharacterized protein n=1 Tax=Kibdelosporangium aridum TaxID=2030 RepID=A0A1W2D182_KIBAR|nr:hypothetical protein [Kibdelosporangium aridum]SMC90758.1 hypothetical protein SAMN05661093_02697 [Kibdelosporangium aridum]